MEASEGQQRYKKNQNRKIRKNNGRSIFIKTISLSVGSAGEMRLKTTTWWSKSAQLVRT
jgi:hypothetical protein